MHWYILRYYYIQWSYFLLFLRLYHYWYYRHSTTSIHYTNYPTCPIFIPVISYHLPWNSLFKGPIISVWDYTSFANPSIYLSSDSNQLPIAINTGASFLIPPTISHVTRKLTLPACASLNQLSGTTPVHGEGPFSWNIKDVRGTCRRIDTQAYYVPDATIHLFSPQTYISNNARTKLVLNANGTYLTLKCGTAWNFFSIPHPTSFLSCQWS